MEASDGLNPVSSQGYAEVQSVEARCMAAANMIDAQPTATMVAAAAAGNKRARTK